MTDLSVLAPPLLVCLAFLVAVGVFLRHEMGSGKSRGDDRVPDESAPDSTSQLLSGDSEKPPRPQT